ncbi:MAG: hypothetical protein U0441_10320 [Polyangiaceae bacterium]
MDEEPLPLTTYATVLAHLVSRRGEPVESVLADLGVTPDQMEKADAYFNERLRESHRLRKGILAMTFAAAFAEGRKARGLYASGVTPTIGGPAPAHEKAALPSYMAAQSGPAAWQSAPSAAVAPPPSVASYQVSSPPPVVSPPQVVSPPAQVVSPPSQVVSPPAHMVSSQMGSPQQGSGAHAAGPPSVASPPSMSHSQAPVTPSTHVGSSAAASPMPFRPTAPGAPPPAISAPSASATPATPAGPGTGTQLAASDGPRLPETPWDQVTRSVGKLTLAHYAALTIELGRNPPDLTPVLQRYGLSSADDLRHVNAAFQTQMAFDPALKAQFDALIGRMRSMSRRDG